MTTHEPMADISDFSEIVHPICTLRYRARGEFCNGTPQNHSFCSPPAVLYTEQEGCNAHQGWEGQETAV